MGGGGLGGWCMCKTKIMEISICCKSACCDDDVYACACARVYIYIYIYMSAYVRICVHMCAYVSG